MRISAQRAHTTLALPTPALRLCVLCALCGCIFVSCGKKGPPLAPIVYLPSPVAALKAKRVEGDIVLEFKVPDVNTDGSSPADLARLEVYGHTDPLPAPADYLKFGTLVQSIEIKPPEEAGLSADLSAVAPPDAKAEATGAVGGSGAVGAAGAKGAVGAKGAAGAAGAKGASAVLVEQGATISVRETLTEKHMEAGPMPPSRVAPTAVAPLQSETLETAGTVNFPLPPFRYYTVVGVSTSRSRRGPYAGPIRVPLVSPLQAPGKLDVTYTADAISLSWPGDPDVITPSAAATGVTRQAVTPALIEDAVQETAGTREIYDAVETAGTLDAPIAGSIPSKPQPPPTPRFGYNVYEVKPTAPVAPIAPNASASAPSGATADKPAAPTAPLNSALLTTPVFTDPRVEFGAERCYEVRRVEMAGTVAIESAPSGPTCVKLVDTFAPAAPRMLQSVASGTTVNLIWEANSETDLAGYMVLRGEAPGDKLAPLTKTPMTDASYTDSTVRRERTYVYEVIAVDKAGNQSAPSNRVEDTIR